MKIVLVTQWFPPEPGTIVARDIAEGLAGLGHQVEVLTGLPNYPTGRIMPGYRLRPYQSEEIAGGIVVHRAALYPSHDQRVLGRMANYLSFAFSSCAVMLSRVSRADVTLVYSSPATAALPAMANRLRGVPYVLLVQDLWPDSVLDASFMPDRLGRVVGGLLDAFCRASYAASSAVAVISPGMLDVLRSRGVPSEKLHHAPNWISDGHLHPERPASPAARRELGLPTGRTFIYAGNFGDLQDLAPVVEAFSRVPEAHLVLVGDGVQRVALEQQVARLGARNVVLVPPKRLDEIGDYLAACDVQVVSLRDTPLMRVTMPSKVQTALASGRPVLACAAGDPQRLVEQCGAGFGSRPGDVDSLVTTIGRFMQLDDEELAAMGDRARACYQESYGTAAGPARLAGVLSAAAGRRSGPASLLRRLRRGATRKEGHRAR